MIKERAHAPIIGLDVTWAGPCKCSCPKTRLAYHCYALRHSHLEMSLVQEAPR